MMRGLIVAIFIIGTAVDARHPPKPKVTVDNRGLLGLLDKYVNKNKRIETPVPNYGDYGSGDYGNYNGNYDSGDYGNYNGNYGSGDYGNYNGNYDSGDYGNYNGNYGSGDYGNYNGNYDSGDYGNYNGNYDSGDYGNYNGNYGNYGSGDYGNYNGDYGNYYNDTDDMECSTVTPPCDFKRGDDAFYKCAFRKLRESEEAIKRIVKDNFGENLFDDYEMDLVWELRKDWKLSVEMKEVVEMVFMEIAESRFSKHDWDKVNSAAKEDVDTKICEYIWLREQTFDHGKFFHKPTHYRRHHPLRQHN